MKIKLISMLTAVGISSAVMGNAVANTGAINFSGAATSSSCTITGLNQTVAFDDVAVADFINLNNHNQVQTKNVEFSVSGCDDTISTGTIEYTFTPHNGSDKDYLALPGATVRGLGVALHDGSSYIKTGQTRNFVIDGGNGTTSVNLRLNRLTDTTSDTGSDVGDATAGNYSGTFNVSMTFS